MTKKDVTAAARLLSHLGASKGGKAAGAAMSPELRRQRAADAARVRWRGHRKKPRPLGATERRILRELRHGAREVRIARMMLSDGREVGKLRYAAARRLVEAGLAQVVGDVRGGSKDVLVVGPVPKNGARP